MHMVQSQAILFLVQVIHLEALVAVSMSLLVKVVRVKVVILPSVLVIRHWLMMDQVEIFP